MKFVQSLVFLVGVTVATTVVPVAKASAHGNARTVRTIHKVFGRHGAAAVKVARCESGLRTWARNGEHLGLFQVSSAWRRTIPGFGPTVDQQVRHAYRVFARTGYTWQHWSCRP